MASKVKDGNGAWKAEKNPSQSKWVTMESPKAARYAKERKFMQGEDAKGRNVGQDFVEEMRNGQVYGKPEWFNKGDKKK